MSTNKKFNVFKLLSLALGLALVAVLVFKGNSSDKVAEDKDAPVELSKSQEVYDLIMTRSSVRSYTDQEISEAQIDTLLRAAMAAPTGGNRQPWSFVVVKDKKILQELSGVLHFAEKQMAHTSLCIVVCGDLKKSFKTEYLEYWPFDCSAATENLLLQAHAMGLGAVWNTVTHSKEESGNVRRILNTPDHILPMAAVTIGYPKGPARPKDKFKPENIVINRFE